MCNLRGFYCNLCLLAFLFFSNIASAEIYELNTRKSRNALGPTLNAYNHLRSVVMDFKYLETVFSSKRLLVFLFKEFYNKHNHVTNYFPYSFFSCENNIYDGKAIVLKMGYPGTLNHQVTYDLAASVMMQAAAARHPERFLVSSQVDCQMGDNNYLSGNNITVEAGIH